MEAGFSAITKMEVYGRGKQRGMRIGEVTYDELPKELILAVVNDADKDFVVDVIMKNARTSPEGAFGDGKIFVSPVDEVYTVRTVLATTWRRSSTPQPKPPKRRRRRFLVKEVMAIIRMNKMNQTKRCWPTPESPPSPPARSSGAAREKSTTCS